MPVTEHKLQKVGRSHSAGIVIALLFVVALINYFDRQSLSVVAPRLQAEIHLSDQGYAHIVSVFLLASAIAYALAGFLSDRMGTRRSMALFVGWWSVAEAATAFATNGIQLGIARFCLGLGEPGLWVAAPKAVGELVDRERQSFAIGVYTAGATVGAVIALPIIHTVTGWLPWRSIFIIDGLVGLAWLPFWLWNYRTDAGHDGSTQQATSVAVVTSENPEPLSDLRDVLTRPETWKLVVARGMTDPVWYFYLFWFPKFLATARHLSPAEIAHVGWTVYLAAGVGTIGGGFISGAILRRGVSLGVAYRRTMLFAAVLLPLSPLCPLAHGSAIAIMVACVIAFAHMVWLVTLTATIVAIYPLSQVGKAAGFIAAGSGLGGMLSTEVIGHVVTHEGYLPLFVAMSVLHPLAIILIWKIFNKAPESDASAQRAQIDGNKF